MQNKNRSARWIVCFILPSAFCLLPSFLIHALEPDELLLIVNKNVPQGRKLAEFYAEKRAVPDHRILELNLPTAEEMPADLYDREVVPRVRAFLRDNGLDRKISCLVTFYGVPIRVAARINSSKDQEERQKLMAELQGMPATIEPAVQAIEKAAAEGDPNFRPQIGNDLDSLGRRAEVALRHLASRAAQAADPAERARLEQQSHQLVEPLLGPMGILERQMIEGSGGVALPRSSTQPATRPASGPATVPATVPATQNVDRFVQFRKELSQLHEQKFDPEARQKLRALLRENLGPFEYAGLLRSQISYFQTEKTTAAFDSELSLLWWEYPRSSWLSNPLHYASPGTRAAPALMVMRLDGPDSGIVSQIILASLKAEKEGLKGRVVLDSRGIPPQKNGKPDPYGEYDQTIRNLADLLQLKSKLSLVLDDRPEVLSAHSAKDVAIYMGWYSVDQYIPACEFHPGAVGFHLASYTMLTLRKEDPRSWTRGLLNDGIAATLGPVAEPFLHSFPTADDFFPLLFTGKLTLAEVYWKTTPTVSWMMTMIGDPLYTPYKTNPALAVEDLPPRLQRIFKKSEIVIPPDLKP